MRKGGYHDWTPRQRWWFDLAVHILCAIVVILGAVECSHSLKAPREPAPVLDHP
jgi:hypothetical protein